MARPLSQLSHIPGLPVDNMLTRLVHDFTRDRVTPIAQELDESEEFPADLYREMAKLNLFGVTIPESLGGTGGTSLDYLLVMEGLSYGYASVADQCGLVELVGSLLAWHGTPAQQERYLRPLLAAERRCAYALTEPHAGSDLGGVRTRAVPAGSDWVLNGEKIFIHNAPVADFAVVLAVTDPKKGKHGGLSAFLVEIDEAAGVFRRYHEHKMGQRASPVGGLSFEEARLPSDALLGEEGQAFRYMMHVLTKGRLGIAGLCLGISRAALNAAADYAATRHQFGRPIVTNQAISFQLADMATEYRAGLLLACDAARLLDSGDDATSACSMAKLFASEACVRHAGAAVQIFGGLGYIRGHLAERLYRDARITTIYEGTSEMQRLIISRSVLPGAAEKGASM